MAFNSGRIPRARMSRPGLLPHGERSYHAEQSTMTPDDESRFIALWQQGRETTAIAQRLGVPRSTVHSRAHRLQQRMLIQLRPRGCGYPWQRALRQHASPTYAPAQSRAEHDGAVQNSARPPWCPALLLPQ
jgi:hypothetical protein